MTQDLSSIESVRRTNTSRPIGTVLLAGLLLLAGIGILYIQTFRLMRGFSIGADIVFHPAYFVDRTRDAVTVGSAILGSVGLIAGRRWGWWFSLFHCYWRIACQSFLPIVHAALAIALADDSMMPRSGLAPALSSGVIFGLLVLYLMREKVRSYYAVDSAERLRANGIAIGLSFPVAAGFYLLAMALQRHINTLPPKLSF